MLSHSVSNLQQSTVLSARTQSTIGQPENPTPMSRPLLPTPPRSEHRARPTETIPTSAPIQHSDHVAEKVFADFSTSVTPVT